MSKKIPLNEGVMKKGGVNPKPTTPKPSYKPRPQKIPAPQPTQTPPTSKN